MAISRINAIQSNVTADGSGNIVCSLSGLTLLQGDVVLIAVEKASTNTNETYSASGNNSGSLIEQQDVYGNDTRDTNLFAGLAVQGSTVDTSITVTGGSASGAYAYIAVQYRGVDTADPTDVASVTANGNNTGFPDPAAITPVSTGAVVLVIYGGVLGQTWNTPGDVSNFIQQDVGSNSGKVACADFAWTSGAFNPAALTGSGDSGLNSWAAVTMALKPLVITLTANVGSYAISGQSVTLTRQLQLTGGAAVGSYAISGVTASLFRSISITADVGSYSISGQTASLLWNKSISAAAGSYVISGQDATLTKAGGNITIVADPGSYAISGVAASLFRNVTLTANVGSYSISGQSANLSRQITITGNVGSYVISGQSASTLWGHLIGATPGSYVISGQSANLSKGYTLSSDVGSYAINGVGVQFPRTYVLPVDVGSYGISGADATFAIGKTLVVDSGSYVITGTAADLRSFRISADVGSYVITGSAATFDTGLLSDLVPIPDPLVVFRHNEAEIVRVPKLNELARQVFVRRADVLSMAELASMSPEMGLQAHVWDAPGGYTPVYADGFNWRALADGTILI